jgi:hypothetical protein
MPAARARTHASRAWVITIVRANGIPGPIRSSVCRRSERPSSKGTNCFGRWSPHTYYVSARRRSPSPAARTTAQAATEWASTRFSPASGASSGLRVTEVFFLTVAAGRPLSHRCRGRRRPGKGGLSVASGMTAVDGAPGQPPWGPEPYQPKKNGEGQISKDGGAQNLAVRPPMITISQDIERGRHALGRLGVHVTGYRVPSRTVAPTLPKDDATTGRRTSASAQGSLSRMACARRVKLMTTKRARHAARIASETPRRLPALSAHEDAEASRRGLGGIT